jgi:hypothetical protein
MRYRKENEGKRRREVEINRWMDSAAIERGTDI